jgi:hypothetical protein
MISRFWSGGRAWCWARDGESQSQAHHLSRTIKYGGGVFFVWGPMTSRGMHYMCKIEEKMTQALYISILQDVVMKTIEGYRFNPSCVIFQHNDDSKPIAKLVKQWLTMQDFDVLTCPPQSHDRNPAKHMWAHVKQKSNEYPTPT